MQSFVTIFCGFLVVGATAVLAGDPVVEKTVNSTTAAPPQPSIICQKCDCTKTPTQIDCSKRNLTDAFALGDWVALNSSEGAFETILFNGNALKSLDLQFPDLKFSIKRVDFSHNQIATFGRAIFKNLLALEEIDLSHNAIEMVNLKPEVFEGRYSAESYEPLKTVKVLKLTNNSLHSLNADIFEHLPNLEQLRLDYNVFQVVADTFSYVLNSVQRLAELDLSEMEIESMPETLFVNNVNLRTLNLAGNLLATVPIALKHAKGVTKLNLDKNPIAVIDRSSPFPPMESLEILHMSYMGLLQTIGTSGMQGLKNLKELHLCNNHKLSFIDLHAFCYPEKNDTDIMIYPPIKKIYLHNNNLTTLDESAFDWDKTEEVELHANPWTCDCAIQWIMDDLITRINKTSPLSAKNTICRIPEGVSFMELALSHSKCSHRYVIIVHHMWQFYLILFISFLLALGICYALVMLYKQKLFDCVRPRGAAYHSRAFYKRAESFESFS